VFGGFPSQPLTGFPSAKSIFKTPCLHLECRLPINLREFIAGQLGAVVDESDETVLNLAAQADEATLSKLARAIRRYSTKRAQQSWEESAVPLASFMIEDNRSGGAVALCLRCARVEFDEGALGRHQSGGCVSLALSEARHVATGVSQAETETAIANRLRRLIEEFRRLRAAFGLPHFKLDCYVHNHHVTFTWRPLP
jgi:hypothetical protein